jgi:hypothetical protein
MKYTHFHNEFQGYTCATNTGLSIVIGTSILVGIAAAFLFNALTHTQKYMDESAEIDYKLEMGAENL